METKCRSEEGSELRRWRDLDLSSSPVSDFAAAASCSSWWRRRVADDFGDRGINVTDFVVRGVSDEDISEVIGVVGRGGGVEGDAMFRPYAQGLLDFPVEACAEASGGASAEASVEASAEAPAMVPQAGCRPSLPPSLEAGRVARSLGLAADVAGIAD